MIAEKMWYQQDRQCTMTRSRTHCRNGNLKIRHVCIMELHVRSKIQNYLLYYNQILEFYRIYLLQRY